MNSLTKNLLLSTLVAVAASGPAFADDGAAKNADRNSTECTSAPGASAQRNEMGDFYTDPHKLATNDDKAKSDKQRHAASSPFQWNPGNPFRDDTAA